MGYDMRQKSLSYTNWRVREMCLNGNNDRDLKIWEAYRDMVSYYSGRTGRETWMIDDEPNAAFYGACGVCCSELLEDEAPAPIIAAFLCGEVNYRSDDGSYVLPPLDFFKSVRGKHGVLVELYAEEAMRLRLADLAEYNKILASGISEGSLAVETSYLWCKTEQALIDYQDAERTPGTKFERHEKLMLRANDPVADELLQCYDRLAVLLNHIKPEWREPMLIQKINIAWICEMVYDTTLWPLPEKK